MTRENRAQALRRQHRHITDLERRAKQCRHEAEALVVEILDDERHRSELPEDLREAIRLRNYSHKLEKWFGEQGTRLAVLCAAADEPF